MAAHGVWLTINEVRLLATAGVSVAHCPVSNMKLASGGVAPVTEMLAENVNVCLGTDGCSSNNSLDMFSEMKFASLLHKASRWDATALNAQQCLDMATVQAAKAIGAEKLLGSIEPGRKADLVILDCNNASMAPSRSENAVASIVYANSSRAVRDTIVDGKFVLRNGEIVTVEEQKVVASAQDAAQELMNRSR